MTEGPSILLATSNPHKVAEVAGVLGPAGVTVLSLAGAGVEVPEPVEDQPTFAGNAAIKARYYAEHSGRPCLADDSGLAVDALDGAPGVRSARFAGVVGERATVDAANNRKLVESLAGMPAAQRTARYVCVMALADGERIIAEARGTLEGRIVDEPRGSHGFGYDPHFWLDDRRCTVAELPGEQKNAISHRGAAARQMLEQMRRLGIV